MEVPVGGATMQVYERLPEHSSRRMVECVPLCIWSSGCVQWREQTARNVFCQATIFGQRLIMRTDNTFHSGVMPQK